MSEVEVLDEPGKFASSAKIGGSSGNGVEHRPKLVLEVDRVIDVPRTQRGVEANDLLGTRTRGPPSPRRRWSRCGCRRREARRTACPGRSGAWDEGQRGSEVARRHGCRRRRADQRRHDEPLGEPPAQRDEDLFVQSENDASAAVHPDSEALRLESLAERLDGREGTRIFCTEVRGTSDPGFSVRSQSTRRSPRRSA